MLDTLPTKTNLAKRGILSASDQIVCILCKIEPKSASHMLFSCKFAYFVMSHYYNWLRVYGPFLVDSRSHFLKHET